MKKSVFTVAICVAFLLVSCGDNTVNSSSRMETQTKGKTEPSFSTEQDDTENLASSDEPKIDENQDTENESIDLSSVKFVDVDYSGEHWGALTDDGKLYMWGSNKNGQIGTGDTSYFQNIVKVMDNVKKVELGDKFSAAIDNDNALYVWGDNSKGELGDGTTEASKSPKKIMENVSDVCVYNSTVMAINQTGELYIWGDNESHDFGEEKGDTITAPIKIMEIVEKICYDDFPYFITKDGKLYTFSHGEPDEVTNNVKDAYCNDYRLYTINKNNVLTEWKSLGIHDAILNNITAVGCSGLKGNEFSGALSADGTLYMWGNNFDHRCGASNEDFLYDPVEVMKNVKQFELGRESSYAVDNNGVLYSWGQNDCGQLCNGTQEWINEPTPVISNVEKIKVWDSCIAVITNDGQLYLGGSASYNSAQVKDQFEIPICINDKSKKAEIITKGNAQGNQSDGLDYNGLPGQAGFGGN